MAWHSGTQDPTPPLSFLGEAYIAASTPQMPGSEGYHHVTLLGSLLPLWYSDKTCLFFSRCF